MARGPKPAPAGDAGETAPPPAPIWRKVRENAEAVIIAIILALIIRHYSLEAFEIPTGSMAPGLHGVHIEATCPNCGTVDEVGINVDQQSNEPTLRYERGWIYDGPCPECHLHFRGGVTQPMAQVYCPRCEKFRTGDPSGYHETRGFAKERLQCHACSFEYNYVFEGSAVNDGHKILVNKFAYQLEPPERWQVIVFKFNRQRNYIKRLTGLPGERIQVIDGDIHIGSRDRPLSIERKPLSVQQQMWQPIHDTDVTELGLNSTRAWAAAGIFEPREEGGLEFNALDGLASYEYRRPIRNIYSYNGSRARNAPEPVRDLRALVDLRLGGRDPEGSPAIWIDIRNGDVVFRLSLPVGAGGDGIASGGAIYRLPRELADEPRLAPETMESAELPAGWSLLAPLPEGTRLDLHRDHEIDFSVVDRQVRAILDGELLVERPLDPRDDEAGVAADGDPANTVTIRARRIGGVVERIRLYRDIHYTRDPIQYRYAVSEPYTIPEDGYFAMGDNSPSSLDSRAWGSLHRQNLLGRAFVIFWPAWPWEFDGGFIR